MNSVQKAIKLQNTLNGTLSPLPLLSFNLFGYLFHVVHVLHDAPRDFRGFSLEKLTDLAGNDTSWPTNVIRCLMLALHLTPLTEKAKLGLCPSR